MQTTTLYTIQALGIRGTTDGGREVRDPFLDAAWQVAGDQGEFDLEAAAADEHAAVQRALDRIGCSIARNGEVTGPVGTDVDLVVDVIAGARERWAEVVEWAAYDRSITAEEHLDSVRRATAARAAAEAAWRQAVREAFAAKVPRDALVAASGVKRARVYQIVGSTD
jgi:hypothetical protein